LLHGHEHEAPGSRVTGYPPAMDPNDDGKDDFGNDKFDRDKFRKDEFGNDKFGKADVEKSYPSEYVRRLHQKIEGLQARLRDLQLAKERESSPDSLLSREAAGALEAESRIRLAHSYVLGAGPGDLPRHWQAVENLMVEVGYEILVEGVEEEGSIWRKWAIRRGKANVQAVAEAIALALEDSYVRKPGAEATLSLARSVSAVFETVGDRECLHVFDNVLIAQFRDDTTGELKRLSKELTAQQRKEIDRDPSLLLARPDAVLARLKATTDAAPATQSLPATPPQ
jgi:hypothetical protein